MYVIIASLVYRAESVMVRESKVKIHSGVPINHMGRV